MEIREAVALYAAPERQDRRADRRRAVVTRRRRAHRGPGRCVLLLSLPVAAAAAGGDPVRHAGGAAHRRDRQGGARVRGVPARGALGLPGLGAGARHGERQAHSARRAHVEQRARAVGRAQAALPAPLHRFPRARRGAGDHPAQGARDPREARLGGGGRRAEDPRARAAQAALGVGVARLGALARHPQRAGARPGAGRVHADDAREVREGPRAGEGRPGQSSRALATFDRIFNLYFLDLEALGEGIKKALGPEDPRVQELLDRLVDEEGLELDDLTELLMRGEGSEMEMAIRAGGQNAGLERLMYFLQDRKSTRLNSSHSQISYAVFCLKKKKISEENAST